MLVALDLNVNQSLSAAARSAWRQTSRLSALERRRTAGWTDNFFGGEGRRLLKTLLKMSYGTPIPWILSGLSCLSLDMGKGPLIKLAEF